jgi:hypothetical protein
MDMETFYFIALFYAYYCSIEQVVLVCDLEERGKWKKEEAFNADHSGAFLTVQYSVLTQLNKYPE